MTTDARRGPSDEMWHLHIALLVWAARRVTQDRARPAGAGSSLGLTSLLYLGDLGGRGQGRKAAKR